MNEGQHMADKEGEEAHRIFETKHDCVWMKVGFLKQIYLFPNLGVDGEALYFLQACQHKTAWRIPHGSFAISDSLL